MRLPRKFHPPEHPIPVAQLLGFRDTLVQQLVDLDQLQPKTVLPKWQMLLGIPCQVRLLLNNSTRGIRAPPVTEVNKILVRRIADCSFSFEREGRQNPRDSSRNRC